MLFQVPGQDVTVPLPGPGNAPDQDQIADTGGGILAFLAGYPLIIAAVIGTLILYQMWKNPGMRMLLVAIGVAVIVFAIANGT